VPVSAWVWEPERAREPEQVPVLAQVRVQAQAQAPVMARVLKTAVVHRTIHRRSPTTRHLTTRAPAFHRERAYAEPSLNSWSRSFAIPAHVACMQRRIARAAPLRRVQRIVDPEMAAITQPEARARDHRAAMSQFEYCLS